MSINSLTNVAVDRSLARREGGVILENAPAPGAAPASPPRAASTSGALDALIKYIPTESVALYLAAAALMPSLADAYKVPVIDFVKGGLYWGFAIGITPLLFILILLAKRREAGLSTIPSNTEFPWWEFVAATIAFGVWAMLIPNGPFHSAALGIVGPVLALAVSMFLNLLEKIFARSPA